jgi:hypothetical protein
MSSSAAYQAARAEKVKAAMKAAGLEKKSLARKIAESSLYDWSSTARFLLTQIAVLAMTDEEDNYPEDAPEEFKQDKIGWCWMAQYKLALRIGKSESQAQRLIARFKKDGVTKIRQWRDDNNTLHDEYQIVESVVDAFQRPSQRRDVERPPRSKRDYKAYDNKGGFRKGRDDRRANMGDDGE